MFWSHPEHVLNGKDAVLFDNDGTLVDTVPLHYKAWKAAFQQYGIEYSLKRFHELTGMPSEDVLSLLAVEQKIEHVPEMSQLLAVQTRIFGQGVKDVKAIAPTVAVLREAKKRGMKTAVVSGGSRNDVLNSLVAAKIISSSKNADIEKVFDELVVAEDVRMGKPSPEPFLLAARRLQVAPTRCVAMEDGDLGLQAIKSAKMRAIDVRYHPSYPLSFELRTVLEQRELQQLLSQWRFQTNLYVPPIIDKWQKPSDILEEMEAVIFDCDGTLVDTMPAHFAAWAEALNKFGIELSEKTFYDMAGSSHGQLIDKLLPEQGIHNGPSHESIKELTDIYFLKKVQLVKPIEPVVEVLRVATKRRMKVAVVSGGPRPLVLPSLVASGILSSLSEKDIEKVFGAIVTAEDVAHGKPHPEPFLLAAVKLGVQPEHCVGLEDGDLGLKSLQSAKMRPVDVRKLEGYPLSAGLRNKMEPAWVRDTFKSGYPIVQTPIVTNWRSPQEILCRGRAIIFDLDGALVDYENADFQSWTEALKSVKLSLDLNRYLELRDRRPENMYSILSREQNNAASSNYNAVAPVKAAAFQNLSKTVTEIALSVDILRAAKRRGLKVGVTSQLSRLEVVACLIAIKVVRNDSESSVAKSIDAIVTSDDIYQEYPSPDPFILAAIRLHEETSDCIGFGSKDSVLWGMQCAGYVPVDIRCHPKF